MKINELVGYKNKPEYQAFKNPPSVEPGPGENDQLRAIAAKLNALGYKQYSIGAGYYAYVYARPQDNYVIKIFREDPGYAAFLNYITKNANNPYVPKLKGKIIKLPNKYSIVRLEKLTRIDIDLFKKIEYAAFNEFDKQTIAEIEGQHPGLLDFVRSLRTLASHSNVGFDLNRSNIMMRGDTPVITDPFA
jgi:hypothetical protein